MALSLVQIVREGGWKTDDDLAEMTGKGQFEVNFEASKSGELLKVFTLSMGMLAIVLDGSANVYHAAPPELRALAEAGDKINFADLPLSLKLSLIEALERNHKKRSGAAWWLPMWMRAELALENHLAAMNLCSPRPRPDDGFYFPCFWHSRSVRYPGGAWREWNGFHFEVAFTGTLNTRIGGSLPPGPDGLTPVRRSIGPHGTLTVNEDSMAVLLTGIAEGRVEERTLRVTHHPTRSRIIGATKRLLLFYSQDNGPTTPFMPLDRPRFELLTKTKTEQ